MSTLYAYSKDIPQYDYVIVKEGDTLWSIASTYSDSKQIRQLIYEITKQNNIENASIYPGDIIKIALD
jgi:LysM repeat protein